jgi:hypothetical protein
MTSSWTYIEYLLRDRAALYRAIERDDDAQTIMRAMLLTIFVGAAVFGASIGSYRGGIQTVFAALKFPIVLLATAAICAPVLTTLEMALGNRGRWRRDLILVATAMATGAMWLVTLAPLIVLADVFEVQYHKFILLLAVSFAVSGVAALLMLGQGIRSLTRVESMGRSVVLLTVFALVGMQMSWTFRPYVVRPRAETVPFVRSLDGSLVEALVNSARSASGEFSRDEAPLPEGS